jgi:hypothetical protein
LDFFGSFYACIFDINIIYYRAAKGGAAHVAEYLLKAGASARSLDDVSHSYTFQAIADKMY